MMEIVHQIPYIEIGNHTAAMKLKDNELFQCKNRHTTFQIQSRPYAEWKGLMQMLLSILLWSCLSYKRVSRVVEIGLLLRQL